MSRFIRNKEDLNHNVLKNLIYYDPEIGIFFWKNPLSNRVKCGDIAGSFSNTNGYIFIGINRKSWSAQRLAWFYMTGTVPLNEIDHINRNKKDNSWKNLRLADSQQNSRNSNKHFDNKTGYKGIEYHKQTGKFRARICINGKRISLGLYDTKEEAHNKYKEAAKFYFKDFYNGTP